MRKIGSIQQKEKYWVYVGRYIHDGKEFDLEVMSDDEDGFFKWGEAKEKFGDNLPSAKELHLIAANLEVVPNFKTDGFYWSSTEYGNYTSWVQRLSDGYQTFSNKNYAYLVRCVRRSEVKS